jgi:hypothetical protein
MAIEGEKLPIPRLLYVAVEFTSPTPCFRQPVGVFEKGLKFWAASFAMQGFEALTPKWRVSNLLKSLLGLVLRRF